ncbi:hypothetical protein E2C01_044945 [Portunus trituberculatus]|uniref:Uncharacterized protein n=1 Tax=Portunus trituberculatus TaxID=210409 RepID=A0A5B7FZQ7_PORTR|nr:hypothetical protein [Portunus trituberculatus]
MDPAPGALETEAGSQPITAKLPRSVRHLGNSNPENLIKLINHGIASCVAEELSSKWDLQMTLKKTVSKAVILILAVMKGLGAIKSEHLAEYRKRQPTLQEVRSCRDTTDCLTSNLPKISDQDRENLVEFKASKTQFLHLSTRHNLPDNYSLFFNNTQLSPSSTLNILHLSFAHNLNWKLHISSHTKTAIKSSQIPKHLPALPLRAGDGVASGDEPSDVGRAVRIDGICYQGLDNYL